MRTDQTSNDQRITFFATNMYSMPMPAMMSLRSLRSLCLAPVVLLASLAAPAAAQTIPGLPQTPSCPPNMSCAPGIPPTTPPATCGPGNSGATCDGGGPAAMGSGSGVNVGAGNPINVINGNKYGREVDMAPLPGTLGLEIVRHYNSSLSRPGSSTNLVGRGWKLSYETDLYVSGRTVQIVQADGTRIIFNRDPRDPSLCASADPANGTVAIGKTARGEEYTWRWADGRQLNFDSKGKLVQILAPNGQFASLQHDRSGLLVKVTDPQGRSLHLRYLDKARARAGDAFRGVQSIASPVGEFRYHYGSPAPKGAQAEPRLLLANLVKVEMPAGRRYYHYEDTRFPTLLTGISEQVTEGGSTGANAPVHLAWQRVATYGYDSNGKANLSVRGLPARLARGADGKPLVPARLVAGTGIDQVTLDFGKGGQTIVTNDRGQPTVFRHAILGDAYRLLEVRGPGCANCGPGNVRYRYDDLGRLLETTTLAADGTPLAGMRTERDARGRPLATSKVAYRNGRPGAPQWQQRFEYSGAAAQPARIFRPSVVAGKEAVVSIAYVASGAAAGKPLSVTEQGYVPSIDPRVPAAAISRTVGYRYNGYGERSAVDGPLPNAGKDAGGANSDVTVIDFDPATKLPLRTRYPGNRVEEIVERDAALRPRVVRITDGPLVRTITTTLNWRGQAERVEVSGAGAAAARYRYDVNGRLLASQDGGGAEVRYAYDAAGRLLARILPDGRREPVSMAPAEAAIATLAPAAPATGIDRDWLSRPVAWHGADGAAPVQASWGAPGSSAETALLTISAGDARAERLVDDFGRVGAIRNPGQGWQLARHDAAGRIVESIDARGARQQAEWDVAGRLLKLVRQAPGGAAAEQTVHYRYAGSLLREQEIVDADGARLTRSEFDAQGRILSQTLVITPARRLAAALPRAVTMRHDWRYDANGRLASRSFTDAAGARFELTEELDAQGRTAGIATAGALPAALGGRRAVASAIDWQAVAGVPFARRIVHGDGSEDGFELPAPAEAMPDAPRLRQASLEGGSSAGAAASRASLRRSPGRDADAAGLPASIATAAADQRLEWNAAGQLVRSARAGGSTRYLYDASRQRVARIVTDARGRATATLFFHHDHHLIAEADAAGRAQYAYAYLGWRPLAQADLRPQGWWSGLKRWAFGAPLRHLHTDRAGRVLAMTQDGETVWQDSEAAAPRVLRTALAPTASAHQPLRYVSQYYDEDSGLSYHGLRYFDPGSGRFLSPDPAGIADAVQDLPAPLRLDLYAYAGGAPDEYFDPDGAARIRFFAITTDAKNKPLGTEQGYTEARWAFIVDNVQPGLPTSPFGVKQNEYAANGTSLLVDVNGDFLKAGQSGIVWSGGGADSGMAGMFTSHYGKELISIPEFTVNMPDADATKLIASYINADLKALFNNQCPIRANLLPEIKFAQGEPNINVTNGKANGAHKQRILACGDGSAKNAEMRRIAKYEAAAEVNETGQINRDCSKDGCPGIGYSCDATKCYSPRDQLKYGPPNNGQPVYTPSFGRSQFIASTFVGELLGAYSSFSPQELAQVGLTPDKKQMLQSAETRGTQMAAWWSKTKAASSYAAANQSWANLSAANKAKFTAETGLGEREYIDMVRIKTQPPRNSRGDNLSGDAKAALITSAIMSNAGTKTYLMGMFENFDTFTLLSHALMRKNLKAAQQYQPGASEEYLAAMVARAHNGGTWKRTLASLTASDSYDYVKNFLGTPDKWLNKGDWKSLRCTENFGADTVKPGTKGKGIGGLEMKDLKLN